MYIYKSHSKLTIITNLLQQGSWGLSEVKSLTQGPTPTSVCREGVSRPLSGLWLQSPPGHCVGSPSPGGWNHGAAHSTSLQTIEWWARLTREVPVGGKKTRWGHLGWSFILLNFEIIIPPPNKKTQGCLKCGYIFAFLSKQQLEINGLPVDSSGFSPAHMAPGTPDLCCSPLNCSSQERAGTKGKGKQVGPGPFLQLFSSRTRLPLAGQPQDFVHTDWRVWGRGLSSMGIPWDYAGRSQGFNSVPQCPASEVFPRPAIPDGSSIMAWHACSVISYSAILWTVAARFLCPWNSPEKNTGEGCHYLLQGIFLTQGSNMYLPCLLHWQADSLPVNHLGKPQCQLSSTVIVYPP